MDATRQVYAPQAKQRRVIQCPHYEILYGGAAGAGKSFLLVLDWLAHWQRWHGNARGVLFRNSYGELQEIREKMEEVFKDTGAKWRDKEFSYFWPDGAKLRLSYLDNFDDALKHKGFEYNWRAHDELTQRPTAQEYIYMFSRMRSPVGVKIRNVSASNPDGPGHLWVKKRFKIDKFPNGLVPIHTHILLDSDGKPIKVFDEEEGAKYDKYGLSELPSNIRRETRIFIPGRLSDNKYLDQDGDYRSRLLALPDAQRRMLLDGRWDVVEGAFFSEWDPNIHVVHAFTPPPDWKRWMAGDWGSSAPYAFLWFAQAPNGDVYVYRELYGGQAPPNEDKGTRESPLTVAERIAGIEQAAEEYISERWLDASCFVNEEHGTSESEQFRQKNVVFQKSQKKFKDGSISMVREYLKVVNGVSRLRFMDNCVNCIRTLPFLQVDRNRVEQYDTDGPDHCADALCYGLRRNIKTREELARAVGTSNYNRRLIKRYSGYGMH